jgi:hypothetical protein
MALVPRFPEIGKFSPELVPILGSNSGISPIQGFQFRDALKSKKRGLISGKIPKLQGKIPKLHRNNKKLEGAHPANSDN